MPHSNQFLLVTLCICECSLANLRDIEREATAKHTSEKVCVAAVVPCRTCVAKNLLRSKSFGLANIEGLIAVLWVMEHI